MTISDKYVFKIGGLELGLSVKTGWEFTSPGRFPDFISENTPKSVYQVTSTPAPGPPPGVLIFDSLQSWRLHENGDRNILWVGSRDDIPRIVGDFSSDFQSGQIYVSESDSVIGKYNFPLGYPMGELLMINLLGTGYGIMLHSCAVIDGDAGFVFAGMSSAGKTTTARLWNNNAGVQVLNDDHTILRKVNDQFLVYGTPWHGEGGYALAADAPIQKIFIIEHAPSNQAVRLSPGQAAASILARCFVKLWDASVMAFTLQFLDELCQTIPCYSLGFVPDQSVVEYVRCLSSS